MDGKPAIYHCLSRVVDRQFLFKKAEKEQFVYFMRLYSRFCGVRILSYCVMSNHFHLLVEVAGPTTVAVTPGYLAAKATGSAATTKKPPAGMDTEGNVKANPLKNDHPVRSTALPESVLCSSTNSSSRGSGDRSAC